MKLLVICALLKLYGPAKVATPTVPVLSQKKYMYICSMPHCGAQSGSSFESFKHLEDKHGLPFISSSWM